jgi:oligogalacturonide transporter
MENKDEIVPPRKVKLINRIGYGSGNLVGSGALALVSSWLMIF